MQLNIGLDRHDESTEVLQSDRIQIDRTQRDAHCFNAQFGDETNTTSHGIYNAGDTTTADPLVNVSKLLTRNI